MGFKERLKLFTGPNHMYYDENPVDFPMWKIEECTWESNLREKDRLVKWVKTRGARVLKWSKEKEEELKRGQLKVFKQFLTQELEGMGEEQSKDMNVKDFLSVVDQKRASQVRAESEGQDPPKKPIKYYPGTRIPVQKVEPRNKNRSTKWLLNNFR